MAPATTADQGPPKDAAAACLTRSARRDVDDRRPKHEIAADAAIHRRASEEEDTKIKAKKKRGGRRHQWPFLMNRCSVATIAEANYKKKKGRTNRDNRRGGTKNEQPELRANQVGNKSMSASRSAALFDVVDPIISVVVGSFRRRH